MVDYAEAEVTGAALLQDAQRMHTLQKHLAHLRTQLDKAERLKKTDVRVHVAALREVFVVMQLGSAVARTRHDELEQGFWRWLLRELRRPRFGHTKQGQGPTT